MVEISDAITNLVADAAVCAGVEQPQVNDLLLHPGAVFEAQLQSGHAQDPVRRRTWGSKSTSEQ